MLEIKTAVISVSDKTGVADFAKFLAEKGVKIISTGGTARILEQAGIEVTPIKELTGNHKDDYFGGRMKTISFNYESSLLFRRDDEEHVRQAKELGIPAVDLVVCNLYPFERAVEDPEVTIEKAVEEIDIGGPCMVRAAAKNYDGVAIVVNPDRYGELISEIAEKGGISRETRQSLMIEAFSRTADYDAAIHTFFAEKLAHHGVRRPSFYQGSQLGRYAENWHQKGWIYKTASCDVPSIPHARQVHGGPLGYNNYVDAEAALRSVLELAGKHGVSIIKHSNPCGYATGHSLPEAFERAWQGDPVSAFGSVIALTEPLSRGVAELIKDRFVEVIAAPSVNADALEFIQGLEDKKNLRLLEFGDIGENKHAERTMRFITGGLLEQESDEVYYLSESPEALFKDAVEAKCPNSGKKLKVGIVTRNRPPASRAGLYDFALKHLKHVKSNAIIIAREYAEGRYQALGMGCGQPNRKDSVALAGERALENLRREHEELAVDDLTADEYAAKELAGDHVALASDAFFPFRDGLDNAARTGVKFVIAPGGSVRDEEVVAAADEHGMGMVFTGVRKFNH